MNSPYVKSTFAQTALDLTPPLIRETLLGDRDFRKEYGIEVNSIISFPAFDISFHLSSLYNAVRRVLSGASEKKVINTKGQKWRLKNISKKGELPNLSLSRGEKRFPLPGLAVLSPDRDTRLRFLDEAIFSFNLPNSASERWRNILSERALADDEVDAFYSELRDTPVEKMRSISSKLRTGPSSLSSLIPPSRKYFEILVGVYNESPSIRDYAASVGRTLFAQLSAWRPYDGFLFSLLLSSHSSLTDEINVDQLSSAELVRAYNFLEKQGDRISQLGAIEVGLRVLPSRPEIEQPLIRLIEQIRDDDVDGQASGFELLSALFCLVDGELSRTRLLSPETPFYRRLAALSQATLIHRQAMSLSVDIDQFSKWIDQLSEWAFSNRGEYYYIQSLSDMRLEPRWDPELLVASQMKANFFGRILTAAKKYEQNIKGSQIYDLLLTNKAGSLQPFSDCLDTWLPGPLDGAENTQNILPSEIAEVIETQLSPKEVGPSSFIALVNFALLYPIDADQAELAAKALKQTDYHLRNIEKKSQIVVILFGLAKVAAVSRNHRLADELRILVRRYRHDTEYALSIEEVIRICLVAAASRSQLDEWTEFVGAWLTELAFGDLKDDEGQIFYSSLNCLCHAVPELWISCGRADAALSALIHK